MLSTDDRYYVNSVYVNGVLLTLSDRSQESYGKVTLSMDNNVRVSHENFIPQEKTPMYFTSLLCSFPCLLGTCLCESDVKLSSIHPALIIFGKSTSC